MEKLTDSLQLVLNAARQHYRDEQWWRSVSGPAYFESNLKKAENRAKLANAIDQLEKQLPEIVKSLEKPNSYDDLASKVCRPELRANFFQFVNTGECVNEHYLAHLDSCPKCQEVVVEAMKRQAAAFENFARYLRKKSDKK